MSTHHPDCGDPEENFLFQLALQQKGFRPNGCGHPGCTEPTPKPFALCNCPTMLYVPAGQHVHHSCPLHGDIVIHGSSVTCSVTA